MGSKGVQVYHSRGDSVTGEDPVRNVAPFTHFSLFFSLFLALTHILLS
jgi:hypothetical protein